jgi:hypothetical protein
MQQITFMTSDYRFHGLSLSENAGVESTLFLFCFAGCPDAPHC